ncbi:MAG: DUF5711 family protein [Hydrogenoanaerobacterium sp.]
MAEPSDIEKIRKKRRRKALLGRILLLFLLTFLGVGIYALKDEVSATGITNFFQDIAVSSGKGSGYPLEFAGDQMRGTYAVGKNLAVLTDSNLYFYNETGKEIRSLQHKYSNPVVRINGSRVLVYDMGGKKLRVESLSRTQVQKELDFPIYAGDISSRGDVAVATGAQRRLAEMTVYDHMLSEPAKYKFKSAENYITDIKFSAAGREIAVAAVNVSDGELASSVLIFKLKEEEPICEKKLMGELIHTVKAARDGFCVVTDSRSLVLSYSGEQKGEYSYNYRALSSFDYNAAGCTALLFGDYRESKNGQLVLLSADGAELWSKEVSANARLLRIGSDRVSIVVDGELQSYDLGGVLADKKSLDKEAFALQPVGGSLYIITPDSIEKIEISQKN